MHGEIGKLGGDPVALLIVLAANHLDKRRGMRAGVAAPRGGDGGRRGDRRRVDGENLCNVALEQGAERAARAVDPECDDLLQVEQPLGLLGGDHPAFKFPCGAGEPPGVGGPVRVQ